MELKMSFDNFNRQELIQLIELYEAVLISFGDDSENSSSSDKTPIYLKRINKYVEKVKKHWRKCPDCTEIVKTLKAKLKAEEELRKLIEKLTKQLSTYAADKAVEVIEEIRAKEKLDEVMNAELIEEIRKEFKGLDEHDGIKIANTAFGIFFKHLENFSS